MESCCLSWRMPADWMAGSVFCAASILSTETGWLAFDAAPGVYGLRLSDGVLDDEHTSMVNLPFQVGFTIKQ